MKIMFFIVNMLVIGCGSPESVQPTLSTPSSPNETPAPWEMCESGNPCQNDAYCDEITSDDLRCENHWHECVSSLMPDDFDCFPAVSHVGVGKCKEGLCK